MAKTGPVRGTIRKPALSNEEWERRFRKFEDPEYYTRKRTEEQSPVGSSLDGRLFRVIKPSRRQSHK